jgi:hypothetical protein
MLADWRSSNWHERCALSLEMKTKRSTAAPYISRWPARLFFFRKNIAFGLEKHQKHLAYE